MKDLLPAKFSAMTAAIERMTTADDGMKALALADAMAAYARDRHSATKQPEFKLLIA